MRLILLSLRNPESDASNVKKCLPLSNLSFTLNVVERLVCQQLFVSSRRTTCCKNVSRLKDVFIRCRLQFWKLYTMRLRQQKTAKWRSLACKICQLPFDTVDHDILLERLRMSCGIHGAAVSWISAFFCQRTHTVASDGKMSETSSVTSGVPRGSVVGPILFLLYTANVVSMAEMHGINLHSYADYSELNLRSSAYDINLTLLRFVSCIDAIDRWMSENQLTLNADKTQFIVLGSRLQLSKVKFESIRLRGLDLPFLLKVTFLDVILDAELSMVQHVRGVTSRCF